MPRVILSRGLGDLSQDRREQTAFIAAALLLIVGLVAGGASRIDPIGHMIVQLSGLGVLGLAAARLDPRADPSLGPPLILLAAMALLPLLQMAPLPPEVWRTLSGHQPLAKAVTLAGLPDRWRPLSLAPQETQRALLTLIAPIALVLAAAPMNAQRRASLAMVVVWAAALSLVVAALQVAGGQAGYLRPRPQAALGQPLGFFVNRNHQAIFLLCAAVFVGALARTAVARGRPVLRPALGLALMGVFVAGAVATLSRAGVLLAAPALVAGLTILRPRWRGEGLAARVLASGAALAFMGILIAMAVLAKGGLIVDRFENGQGGGRLQLLPHVLNLAQGYQPFGAGLGAFDLAYRAAEPLEQIDPFYLNHAHNDFAELWLEAGWPGLLLVTAFLVWWADCLRRRWGASTDPLGRAGTAVIGLLLAHSLVDYPLRTPAMALVMALACVLAMGQPVQSAQPQTAAPSGRFRSSRGPSARAELTQTPGHEQRQPQQRI